VDRDVLLQVQQGTRKEPGSELQWREDAQLVKAFYWMKDVVMKK
jgi:hypothetical protein